VSGNCCPLADVVFTGGVQLESAMRGRHPAVHCFPSSVDIAHFGRARSAGQDPSDQVVIGRPRLGYFGVIDERLDLGLIRDMAAKRPEWEIVLVGPIAKIGRKSIPSAPNIYRLGKKSYDELPAYLGGWDVAIMPFAHNEATRYISPTKTPEYLAGGRPVASTSIADVVHPYAALGLVCIGDGVDGFIEAVERALRTDVAAHRERSDLFLANCSWDETWAAMAAIVDDIASQPPRPSAAPSRAPGSSWPAGERVPAAGAPSGRAQV
jgi:glycosyltransferase involved in cell wall biosynthesis